MDPFSNVDSFSMFQKRIENVVNEIKGLDNEYVLKISTSELEKYYIDIVTFNPLILHVDKIYIKEDKGSIDILLKHAFRSNVFPEKDVLLKGTVIKIAIPFNGDRDLWSLRPSTFILGDLPNIHIDQNEIEFIESFPDGSKDLKVIKSNIDKNIKSLEDNIKFLNIDVKKHNDSAPKQIIQALKEKIENAKNAKGIVLSLGIPIKRRENPPPFTVPLKRRVRPIAQPTNEFGALGEPILDKNEYDFILKILRSMSLVIERNPSSFANLKEEAIRNHFLIQLNGHYEGKAMSEAFNAAGKTDILIREGNRNAFIAECKFWRGPNSFKGAIEQLLSYLTWRDSKCALLIFNRNMNSENVRKQMHQEIVARHEHRKTIFHESEGDSRYILVKPTDPNREIVVTTQLYDIPRFKK